ncbi:nucleotidyltransferase family protein [uncultured Thiodictyon sp.]|uniref:nucleotidyltransferase domain-containing protein n=1 Tax=uncultured Thiodictyon sp. TaxID=1846217 RepID=UPI0025CE2411|nr:nucleotidyltransferase family protein [uncultured Thiodictyon sp.]
MPTPFADLLLQILHSNPSLPAPDRLAALGPSDWTTLTRQAIRDRLAFQLSEYLKTNQGLRARVPAADLQRLNDRVRSTLLYNLRRQIQLRTMCLACESAGIPFLLLKGLWLVETIYGDLKARASGDIDLLLRPQDMPRFTALARTQGFKVPSDCTDLRQIAAINNEFKLIHPVTGAFFDIHWSLTHPIDEVAIDEDRFWQRSESATLAGQPCRTPCLEDHLLLLCFHAAIHHRFQYVGPRAMLDIAQVITRLPRPIDWDDFLARAHELGWSRGVWLMLELVREHLGVQPPAAVLDGLRPTGADDADIRKAALEAMFLHQQPKQMLGNTVEHLANEKTARGRVVLLLKRLFPARRYIANYFTVAIDHPGIHWLYVKRWGIIITQMTPRALQLWTNDPRRTAELKRSTTITKWLRSEKAS